MSFRTYFLVIPNVVRNLKSLSTRPGPKYYVYVLTNSRRILYVGVTSDLVKRVYQHKHKLVDGFTKQYNVSWLAYYEETSDIEAAIAREKQIKAWRRSKKVELVERQNPQWKDLSLGWFDEYSGGPLDSSLRSEWPNKLYSAFWSLLLR